MARVLLSLVFMIAVIVGLSFYLAVRLVPSGWPSAAKVMTWATIALLVGAVPTSFLLRETLRVPIADEVYWVVFSCMGLFFIAVGFVLLRDALWLVGRFGGALPADPERRRMVFEMTSAGVVALVGSTFSLGVSRALSRPAVVNVTVPIPDLPEELVGFKIVQVSDLHVGPTIKKSFVDEIVATINGLDADLVALTGDVADGSVEDLREDTDGLKHIRSRHGTYYVTGNHEYYWKPLEWIREMERLGMRALLNGHHVLEHLGHKIVVAGVTDMSSERMLAAHKSDPKQAIDAAPHDAKLRLLLAHRPRSAYAAAPAGFHLQLSGHTHGGQFFPGTWLINLVEPFAYGLHRHQNMWVYTNRGTGYWGPPVRTADAASEVTKITLVRA